MRPIYDHNRQFFDSINESSSYWAGFLAADGNINCSRDNRRLACVLKDRDHVEKLKISLNATNPIKIYKNNDCFHLNLELNFNITKQKTFTLCHPELNNECDIRAFIRGYFDGDGSLYLVKDAIQISFVGTLNIIQWILDMIRLYIDPNIKGCIDTTKSIHRVRFTGRRLPKDILEWMYKDSNDNLRLTRKHNRFIVYYLNGEAVAS